MPADFYPEEVGLPAGPLTGLSLVSPADNGNGYYDGGFYIWPYDGTGPTFGVNFNDPAFLADPARNWALGQITSVRVKFTVGFTDKLDPFILRLRNRTDQTDVLDVSSPTPVVVGENNLIFTVSDPATYKVEYLVLTGGFYGFNGDTLTITEFEAAGGVQAPSDFWTGFVRSIEEL